MEPPAVSLVTFLSKFKKVQSKWLDLIREVAPYVNKKYVMNRICIPTDQFFDKFMKSKTFGKPFQVQLEYFRTSKAHLVPKILLCSMGIIVKKTFTSVLENTTFEYKDPKIDGVEISESYHPSAKKLKTFMIYTMKGILSTPKIRDELLADAERPTTKFANIPGEMGNDLFRLMISIGQLKGRDLISLCVSDPTVNKYCKEDIFAILLEKEFGIANVRNPRRRYDLAHGAKGVIYQSNRQPYTHAGILGISKSGTTGYTGFFTKDNASFFLYDEMYSGSKVSKLSETIKSTDNIAMSVRGINSVHATFLDKYERVSVADYLSMSHGGNIPKYATEVFMNADDRETAKKEDLRRPKFIDIASGGSYDAFLDTDGMIWLYNEDDWRYYAVPLDPEIRGVKKIAMSTQALVAISETGSILLWELEDASGIYGPIDFEITGVIDVAKARDFGAYIDENREVWFWGIVPGSTIDHQEPALLELDTNAMRVLCGDFHMIVMDEHGDVYFLGDASASGVSTWSGYVNELTLIPDATDVLDIGVTSNSVVYFK